jgi:hypothetical protein
VCFAQKRFCDHGDFYAGGGCFHCGPQTRASGANDQNVVVVRKVLSH